MYGRAELRVHGDKALVLDDVLASMRSAVNEAVTAMWGPAGMLDDPLSGPCVAAAVRRACHASRAAAEAHALR